MFAILLVKIQCWTKNCISSQIICHSWNHTHTLYANWSMVNTRSQGKWNISTLKLKLGIRRFKLGFFRGKNKGIFSVNWYILPVQIGLFQAYFQGIGRSGPGWWDLKTEIIRIKERVMRSKIIFFWGVRLFVHFVSGYIYLRSNRICL